MNTLTVNQFAAQHEIEIEHALYILDNIFTDPGISTKAKSSTSPYFIASVETGAPDLITHYLNAYYDEEANVRDEDAADDGSPVLEAEEVEEVEEVEELDADADALEETDLEIELDQLNALNALSAELTMKEYRRRLIDIASAHGDAVAFVNRHLDAITAQLEVLGLRSLDNQKAKLMKEARNANK